MRVYFKNLLFFTDLINLFLIYQLQIYKHTYNSVSELSIFPIGLLIFALINTAFP